jgi:hypothetical protein
MLASVPFVLTLDLDPGAISQKLPRTAGATIWDACGGVALSARRPSPSQDRARSLARYGA